MASIPDSCDVMIIGAGPGGLTAAVYLRRFLRDVVVIDKGHSRLALVPVTHNYSGFPQGIPGKLLLSRLTEQLSGYDTPITRGEVSALRRDGDGFLAECDVENGVHTVRAAAVILATGIADTGLPVERWHEAVARGAIRLCPVCDGFDVLDKKIAVVTSSVNAIGHALFMRTFSADVTLFERDDATPLTPEQRAELTRAGVRHVGAPLKGVTMSARMTPVLHTGDGAEFDCDVLYPMLGETARSRLAQDLGARCGGDCGELVVDAHQRTSVANLYAVGDVVLGLNQISVATGQAAVAATAIHAALPLRPRAPA